MRLSESPLHSSSPSHKELERYTRSSWFKDLPVKSLTVTKKRNTSTSRTKKITV